MSAGRFCAALVAHLSIPLIALTAFTTLAGPQILRHHVPAAAQRLKPLRRMDPNARLDLAIGLPLRNRPQLTNLLEQLYNPDDPQFRHYLTATQFAEQFGPTEADYQAVRLFAKTHRLNITGTHPNRTLLDVSGRVADIESAFHTHLQVYQHPTENRTFFAPDVEPSLDLDTPVLTISGLDSFVRPRPQSTTLLTPVWPEVKPQGGGGSGGGGGSAGSGPEGLYLGYDFRTAYAAGVSLDGTGQSIALFELTGYDENDISAYEQEAGLPSLTPQDFLIDNFDGDDTNYEYSVEATSDIEMAIAMAPGLSNLYVYEGPTPLWESPLDTNYVQYASTTAQINDVFNQMATDNLAHQLSCSYDMDVNASTMQIFQQFAAQGQTLFLPSGDSGGYPAAVDEPSDNPNATVVGGTTLHTSSAGGPWLSEKVWLTPASYDFLLGYTPEYASGGGISTVYPIPLWQQGISMTANQGSTTMRNIPDVAIVANNIDVVWGDDYYGMSLDNEGSGTSLAAPLWAGLIAMANQQAALNGQPPVGFANPALYAIAKSTNYQACFHDVTSGNNYTPNSPSKYSATAGYDLCSGWGTPIARYLIPALLAPPVDRLLIWPPLGFTSFGPSGGPFTNISETFTLTNLGTTPLLWNVLNPPTGLTVSPASGQLNPLGPATSVTVSLNGSATNLLIGDYSGNVTFVNETAGTKQNREFDLYVGNGGFETGDFTDWTFTGQTDLCFALSADDVDIAGTNALSGEPDALFVHSGLYGAYLGEFPDDGSLSQTVATTPGQLYLVSFWLANVPYEGSTTPNDFTFAWNGTALYAQTNLPAFSWTNLQYIVPGKGSSGTIEFIFDNVPGAFGLDDVTVEPLPAPQFQGASVTGTNLTLSWNALMNFSYDVQAASDMSNPNWTTIAGPILATNTTLSVLAPIGSGTQQFYRVVLVGSQ